LLLIALFIGTFQPEAQGRPVGTQAGENAMQMTQRNRSTHLLSRTTARAVGVGLALLLAGACGSSKPAAPSTSPSTSTSTSTSPSTTPSTSPSTSPTPSASASGTAPADPAAAKTQITQNWQKFFDPATSLADKATLLENGDQLKPVLQGFAADPRVGQIKATVTDVAFTSPTTATVTYSLALQGTVVQSNATGKAVLQNGTWKVSLATLCGLVALSGNTTPIPGCS
jgi:hypothetical protein